MIKTKFKEEALSSYYERIMPYPVRVGDKVDLDLNGFIYTVTEVIWVVEENPHEEDSPAFVYLLATIG
jgi:hypothetical protein